MSAPIGPGDWVECVDDAPRPGTTWRYCEDRVWLGQIYQVADCFVNRFGEPSISLVGKERTRTSAEWGTRLGYGISRFRPIYRPKQSIIDALKAPPKRARVRSREAA